MPSERDSHAHPTKQQPPASVTEALERARRHARNAGAELLAAARALLDAASLALSGQPSEAHAAIGAIARGLEDLGSRIAEGGAGVPQPVVEAILAALDAEIARWEERSEEDTEARAVLRTFLGLREILWEFGLRRDGAAVAGKPRAPGGRRKRGESGESKSRPPRRPRRVQRVGVQG